MTDTPTTLAARVARAREALADPWHHPRRPCHVADVAHLRAALDALDEVERERDRLRALLRGLLDYEAEGARYRLFSGCTCLGRSKHNEQLYEAGKCPHQLAEAALGHGGGGRA